MSAALAFGWYIWTRHRRGLVFLGGYWLMVMIFCRAVPDGAFRYTPDQDFTTALLVGVFIALCCGLAAALAYLLMIFTLSREMRLEVRESGFPTRLWHLPLSTRTLAGWPMLGGSATVILSWLTLAWAARRPCGFEIPLWWPGLLLAVVLAWLQAIVWTPFPLPWVRVFLLFPLSSVLVVMPTAILDFEIPVVAACGWLVALLSAAYLTGFRGVARARHGGEMPWNWPAWLRWRRKAMPTRPPFASAAQAQLWFEWRRRRLYFPGAVFSCVVVWLPMLSIFAMFLDQSDKAEQPIVPSLVLHELGSLWLVVVDLLLLMPLLAAACGPEMGRLPGRDPMRVLSSFLATRPVSVAQWVRAKLAAAARSTLAGWGVLVVSLLIWFALSGRASEMAGQFEAMRQRHPPALFWGWLTLLVGGAVVLTWLQIVQGLWMGLAGHSLAIPILGFGIAACFGAIGFGEWLARYPEYWSAFGRLLPWLAGVAVVLKCLAAAWSLRMLKRRELIPSGVLWGTLALWLVLAAGLFAALYVLLPNAWFSASGVLLGIVLLLPLTRLALAPLALAWNRHG